MGWVEEWIDAGVEGRGAGGSPLGFFVELALASRCSLRNAIDDAYVAALAISRGATLAPFDQDFEPFARHGLRWERPGS